MARGQSAPTNGGSMAERWLDAITPPPLAGTRSVPYAYEGASAIATGATNQRICGQSTSGSRRQSRGIPRRVRNTRPSLPLQSGRAWHSAFRPSGGASGRRTPVPRLLHGLSQERLCRFRSQDDGAVPPEDDRAEVAGRVGARAGVLRIEP